MILNIFYALGLVALFGAFINIYKLNKFYFLKEWIYKSKKVNGKSPKLNEFRSDQDYNNFVSYSVCNMVLLTWIFIGLLTSDWIAFLFLFLIRVFLNFFPKWNYLHKLLLIKKSIIEFLVILFLIINNFFWKINISELFNNL